MNEEENLYWRGFDARLARIEDLVQGLDESLRGDRRKKIIGLLAEFDRLDERVRQLYAVVIGDAASNHGMRHDVDMLMGRRKYDGQIKEFRWKHVIPTLLAILALTISFLANLDKILKTFRQPSQDPVDQMIEKAKHPKGKTLVRYRHVQAEAPSGDTKE